MQMTMHQYSMMRLRLQSIITFGSSLLIEVRSPEAAPYKCADGALILAGRDEGQLDPLEFDVAQL